MRDAALANHKQRDTYANLERGLKKCALRAWPSHRPACLGGFEAPVEATVNRVGECTRDPEAVQRSCRSGEEWGVVMGGQWLLTSQRVGVAVAVASAHRPMHLGGPEATAAAGEPEVGGPPGSAVPTVAADSGSLPLPPQAQSDTGEASPVTSWRIYGTVMWQLGLEWPFPCLQNQDQILLFGETCLAEPKGSLQCGKG
ncbi:hypothetical protein NDU88_003581 [Pleurodeles waltl]|uniref:Uncharacterized protein n=1 Tax=Pleurodeles waltl TaxID=8319 RepID=A0AAV7KXD1_PLEWA|nr:hypothetical protein NDU88_003581 [Pleurodeles waltl]